MAGHLHHERLPGGHVEGHGDFWRPKPDAAEYTTLALATGRTIREAEPSATIIAPAMSGFDWKYMESFLQSGVLEFLDGVSVHLYRDPNHPPETAATDYKRLREQRHHRDCLDY